MYKIPSINKMKKKHTTSRLSLEILKLSDAVFVKELVNSSGWLRFIGERSIHHIEDAENYIKSIDNNPYALYWTVSDRDTQKTLGIVTYIKRDYLDQWDIGFAFLPESTNQGYALEACQCILAEIMLDPGNIPVVAVTTQENTRSIRLLEKLGLNFQHRLDNGLMLYTIYQ